MILNINDSVSIIQDNGKGQNIIKAITPLPFRK